MNTKPKYSTVQNIWWMIKNAWEIKKSVLLLCILFSIFSIGINLTQLFIAPEILSKVEQQVPLSELLETILFFSVILFLLLGGKAYITQNTMYGRSTIRTHLVDLCAYKTNTTSYPNTLDTKILKMREAANKALFANASAGEHIWTTLCNLIINSTCFAIYFLLLSQLNIFMIAIILITGIIGFFFTERANEWIYQHRDEEAKYNLNYRYFCRKAESSVLAKDIRIFGLAGWVMDIQDDILRLVETFWTKQETTRCLASIANVFLTLIRNGVAYFYLINLVLQGNLTPSEFLLYFSAVSGFTEWVTGILNECSTLHKESLDLSATREYLDVNEPFLFEEGIAIPSASQYELRLENVSYHYPDSETDIIHHMNLTIHPGEKLAVVGLNGAGKTTLIKLICGFLDPTEGKILLNGQDIRTFNRRDYYALFSAIFQEYSILDISIAENISPTATDIDYDKIQDCLEKSGLAKKISELPEGVSTHIGREIYDDGIMLSGGEMQRLMLARALYKDGPVLILDEPTAALDPIAENEIYLKYNEMAKGKTSIFISHRLASTRFCDRILFIADGQIVEEGSHEELLSLNGKYAELFAIQSRYYQEGRDF